jgi:hypothetical protein
VAQSALRDVADKHLVVPMPGHTVNIEEPALFNEQVADFLAAIEGGRWGTWKREGQGLSAAIIARSNLNV